MSLVKRAKRTWCNCGVNKRLYPHDQRVCAAKLSTRLNQMVFYLAKTSKSQYSYLNMPSFKCPDVTKSRLIIITAFPHLLSTNPKPMGCVICGDAITVPNKNIVAEFKNVAYRYHYSWGGINDDHDFRILASACDVCYKRGDRLCRRKFQSTRKCIEKRVVMLGLCLKQFNIPKDIRLFIRRLAFPFFPSKCDC